MIKMIGQEIEEALAGNIQLNPAWMTPRQSIVRFNALHTAL